MGSPRITPERREELARAYREEAHAYDRIRPGYPEALLDWLCAGAGGAPEVAIDLGAGSGLASRALVERGAHVVAVDPSAAMLEVLRAAVPAAEGRVGTAEAIPADDESCDLVLVAQAWHWFDPRAAGAEIARVLRPGGALAILVNQLDVRLPWVHRLSRIMRAGDVHDASFRPALPDAFGPWEFREQEFFQRLDAAGVADLMRSRSAWRRSSTAVRARMEENLRWYLEDHLGFDESVDIPYRCFALRAVLGPEKPCSPSPGAGT